MNHRQSHDCRVGTVRTLRSQEDALRDDLDEALCDISTTRWHENGMGSVARAPDLELVLDWAFGSDGQELTSPVPAVAVAGGAFAVAHGIDLKTKAA